MTQIRQGEAMGKHVHVWAAGGGLLTNRYLSN
jgi:hypothetical protein